MLAVLARDTGDESSWHRTAESTGTIHATSGRTSIRSAQAPAGTRPQVAAPVVSCRHRRRPAPGAPHRRRQRRRRGRSTRSSRPTTVDAATVPDEPAGAATPSSDVRRLPLPAAVAHRWWPHWSPPLDRLLGRPDVVHGTNYVVPADECPQARLGLRLLVPRPPRRRRARCPTGRRGAAAIGRRRRRWSSPARNATASRVRRTARTPTG